MSSVVIFLFLLILATLSFLVARQRAFGVVSGQQANLHSRPSYHGWYAAILTAGPGILLLAIWTALGGTLVDSLVLSGLEESMKFATSGEERLFLNDIHNVASGAIDASAATESVRAAAEKLLSLQFLFRWSVTGLALIFAVIGALTALNRVNKDFRARTKVEKTVRHLLLASSVVAILTTIGIVASLLFESLRFFSEVSVFEFLFGTQWSPQTALREDQVGSSGAFGAVPLFTGTLLISMVAMLVAVPVGLMSAIYMTQYARRSVRKVAKPLLEILAGIPTVVFGFFAALTVAPLVRDGGGWLSSILVSVGAFFGLELEGFEVASESALAAGLVMGIMIIPLMSSLSDDAITAVPRAMKDGSLALGATPSETIKRVLIPAALPGIVGAFLLSVSRAIGETMIVVMAAGLAANLTFNPLDAVTTVTAQIVALLTGDQEFDSAKTLSAFALGLVLLIATLALNIMALRIVRKYREAYE